MAKPLHLLAIAILWASIGGVFILPAQAKDFVDVMSQRKFKEMTKDMSPRSRFEAAAMIHIALGQYEQAVPLLEALVGKNSKDAGSWELLAIAYNRLGEAQDAFETANIAITLRPTYDAFLMERGIAAFQLGKDRQAASDLARFVKSYPNTPEAWFYLGLAQARLGDSAEAAANLRQARTLNPLLSLMTDYYLGLIAAQQGKTIQARELLKGTLDAFKDVDSPMKEAIRRQLKLIETQPDQSKK